MLNVATYEPILVIIGVVTAAITGARLAFVMGKRWNFKETALGWMCCASAGSSALVCGILTAGAIEAFGLLAGMATNLASLPLIGFSWVFLIGGNKIVERILGNLLNKLTD